MARNGLLMGMTAFTMSLVAALGAFSPAFGEAYRKKNDAEQEQGMETNKYAGMWVTGDGYIRHELLPNGRYVEARGSRERAYEGRYALQGDHIDYVDDTGFTADGEFRDGILYHAGMVLYRR